VVRSARSRGPAGSRELECAAIHGHPFSRGSRCYHGFGRHREADVEEAPTMPPCIGMAGWARGRTALPGALVFRRKKGERN